MRKKIKKFINNSPFNHEKENIVDNNKQKREEYIGDLLIILFQNPRNAQYVYTDLLNRGYAKENITIMMTEETEKQYFSGQDLSKTELGDKGLEGMGIGGVVGGAAGALAAGIAALGTSLIIPGLGIIVAGALAAALAGGGAGALAGGLVGLLVGLGISDEQAKEFEDGIKAGGVVIGVHTRSQADYKQLNQHWQAFKPREDYIF